LVSWRVGVDNRTPEITIMGFAECRFEKALEIHFWSKHKVG